MINPFEVMETINMIDRENLDIRTITMGISLKSCAGPDVDELCESTTGCSICYFGNSQGAKSVNRSGRI